MNELQFADQLVADLLDAQPQPVFWMKPVWDKDHKEIVDFEYSYGNEEFFKATGYSKKNILRTKLSSSPLLNEELRLLYVPQFREVFLTGKKVQDTYYNPVLNKYFSFLRTKVQDGVLTVIQDRTAEYIMIRELEKQQLLLNNILNFSSSGISVTEVLRDRKGNIVDGRTLLANEAAAKLTGIPKDEFMHKTAAEIDPNILKSQLYDMVLRTLETGQPFHTQYYLESSDRWIELSGSKMDNDRVVNVYTDITASKKAQLEIERSAENLRKFINTSQSAMALLIPYSQGQGEITDFTFRVLNNAFAAYIKRTPEELLGHRVSQWFPSYMENGLFELYKETFVSEETKRTQKHYSGENINAWLDILSTKMEDGVLVTIIDFTHMKQLQLDLERIVAELRKSNSYLEEFAYAASHDLKEPIRKIHTFADRLKPALQNHMNPQELDMFERMQNATKRMQQLVDDLLEYSALSSNAGQQIIDLNEILKLVITDLEVSIEEKNASVVADTLPIISGNKRQLQQLFQNLISNSLKYSKENISTRIRINFREVKAGDFPGRINTSESNKPYNFLQFHDNGIGFEKNDSERIFAMFQRLHGKHDYSGTGIGLSIVRKIVENHGGNIWAEGEVNKGATFNILLPK
jgi:PAS domain S-box-containing protein